MKKRRKNKEELKEEAKQCRGKRREELRRERIV